MCNPLRVLFVDDEEPILRTVRRLFAEEPWRCDFARSGEEALELFAKNGAYDLVVTDHIMQGMTGVDLLRELRSRYPRTIRTVLSGRADLEVVLDAINSGAVYKFWTKPIGLDVLRDAVREVAELARLRNENRSLSQKVEEQGREIDAIDWLERELDDLELEPPGGDGFRAAIDALPVAVVLVDGTGRIGYRNGEAARLLGGRCVPGANYDGSGETSPCALTVRKAPYGKGGGAAGTAVVLWEQGAGTTREAAGN